MGQTKPSLFQRLLRRLKTEAVDACTYFLLAVPALLLPWALAYRIYFRLAALPWVFAYPARVAAENMAQFGITSDLPELEAKRRFRLVLMIDIVDMWLSIVRGRHALSHLVRQNRNWPEERRLMVIGSHWGPGMLGIRSMRSQGLLPHFVIRPVPSELRQTRFLFWLYRRVRTWHLNQLLPGKRFNTGTSPRHLIQAMEQGASILMLADTPAESERETIPVQLYGKQALIHRGFTKTLARRKIPYVTFSMGLNWQDGRREIDVRPMRVESDASVIQQDLASFINETLWRDPGQWQMWPFTKQFLRFVEA